MKNIRLFIVFFALIGLVISKEGLAQSESSESFTGIEEIIVTARKKEEPLQ